MEHIVCGNCGILLECDWMGIGIDYDDECEKTDGGHHYAKDEKCDCESHILLTKESGGE